MRGVVPLSLDGGGSDTAVMYGGWLDHSWFFTYLTGRAEGGAAGAPKAFGWSIGATTESLPADGSAVWRGVMLVGETERRELLLGDAVLTVDFGAASVDIAFTDIRDTDTGARRADIQFFDVPMSGGGFARRVGGNTVAGVFYGPSHLEIGGAFEHGTAIGAFAATRR